MKKAFIIFLNFFCIYGTSFSLTQNLIQNNNFIRFDSALSAQKTYKDSNDLAYSYLISSVRHQNNNDYSGAADQAEFACRIYRMTHSTEMLAYSLTYKSNFLWHLRRLNESLSLLHEVMNLADIHNFRTDNPRLYYFIIQELATVSQLSGHLEKAQRYFEISTEYYLPKKLYAELAANHIWQGFNEQAKENYPRAGEHFLQAIAYAEKIKHPDLKIDRLTSAYNNYGCNEIFQGNFETGIAYLKKALSLQVHLFSGIDDSHFDLGEAYLLSDQLPQAEYHFRKAIHFNRNHWKSLSGLARIMELSGQTAAADSLHQRAIAATEKRSEYLEGQSIVAFFEKVVPVYREAARFYASTGQPVKSLDISERSKSRYLKYLADLASYKITKGIDPGLLDSLKTVERDITAGYAGKKNGKNFTAREDLQLQTLELEKINLQKSIKHRYPDFYQLQEPGPANLKNIQATLEDRFQILNYIVTRDSLTGIVINGREIQTKIVPVRYTDLKKRIRAVIQSDHRAPEELFQLYTIIFEPFKPLLIPERELIIIPDGILFYLPFDMLVTSSPKGNSIKDVHYLLYDYPVSYASSASMFLRLLDNKTGSEYNYGGFAASQFGQFPALPHTAEQIADACGMLEPGDEFSVPLELKNDVLQNAHEYKILDFATHAVMSDYEPMFSKIIFYDDSTLLSDSLMNEQSALRAYEVYNLNLQADLVVLSGCRTGLGRYAEGEGIVGFNHAFTYAGANSLLMSQWAVDDESTLQLMRFFYSSIRDGMSKSRALRQAKINFLRNANELECDPAFWAAFTLWGNPDRIELNCDYNWILFFVPAGLLALGLIIKRRKANLNK